MKKTVLLSLVIVIILGLYFWSPFESRSKDNTTTAEITKVSSQVTAANTFLSSLPASLRGEAMFEFTEEERFNWHYIPRERKGLDFRKLDDDQKAKAMALLSSFLSDQGISKAKGIMELESVLKVLENQPPESDRRDPEKYYFSIFGEPSESEPWGWRMEGHHLSLNFTSVSNELVVTPAFMGTNPAKVPSGPKKGLRVLKDEEDFGRTLVKMLSPEQQKIAILSPDAPDDMVTAASRKAILDGFSGVKYTDMTKDQQAQTKKLLDLYLSNMQKDIKAEQLKLINEAGGIEAMYFAWMGSLEVGERHYYRLHGPRTLIEYDNTQNDANHIHTVWRDLTNDFGEDLLAKHYAESGAGHGHSH